MKSVLTPVLLALVIALPLPAQALLDPAETDTLMWMREEEKLARDTYLTLYQAWGLNVFTNIAKSEQRHMDTLLGELKRFGLPDPIGDDSVGVFTDPTLRGLYDELVGRGEVSLLEGLHVGAYIEELDIADLWNAIDQTDEPSLINAYENLLAGSRNHLRAFVSQIRSSGADYVAQYLSQEQVDTIVDGYELPKSEFQINAGLTDAWYNPETSGQGFFITVYPDAGIIFLAWFTFDSELPADDAPAQLGWSGHRWLTAQGPYDGSQGDLQVYVTGGGLFDSGDPEAVTVPDGSILLNFEGCDAGTVSYDLPAIGQNGVIPIRRIATDNVAHCENLASK